jgi:hypothetical protein
MIFPLATLQNPLKKTLVGGGAPKKHKNEKAYGGGAGYLPSNFVLFPCVAVRRKKRRSARSLAPSLAILCPVVACDSPFLACLQLRDSCVNSALLSHHIAKRADAVFLMPFTAPDLVQNGVWEPQTIVVIVVIVVVSCLLPVSGWRRNNYLACAVRE